MVSISNYAMLALLDMSAMALVPLVWSTPIDLGGLSFSPASIGLWLSGYGCLNGVIQFVFFPRVVGRLGPGRVVFLSVALYVIIYSMFPFENLAARLAALGGGGVAATVWPLVVLQLVAICITDMGFSESHSSSLAAPIVSLTPLPKKKNRFCIHVPSCRCSKQALARCYEWVGGDRGRHPTYGRPHRRGIVVCIFPGERRSGWEFCVCRVPRRRVHRSMRCRTAAAVHVEAQRLEVTRLDGVLYIYGTAVILYVFLFLSENFVRLSNTIYHNLLFTFTLIYAPYIVNRLWVVSRSRLSRTGG